MFNDISSIQVVATALNGNEVIEKVQDNKIDIALLDINMPGRNGVEVCKYLSEHQPDIRVIALSMHKENSFVRRMKKFGARGYMLKDDSKEELIHSIKTVHKGETYFSPRLGTNIEKKEKNLASEINTISEREIEILKLIARGNSNKEICSQLFLSIHTVDSHRKNMLNKFQAKNSADLVRLSIEKGII